MGEFFPEAHPTGVLPFLNERSVLLRLQTLLCGCILAIAASCAAPASPPGQIEPIGEYQISFLAGSRDDAGRFMGGTELRILTAYRGKLYAGNGYWEDRPGPEGSQGAQILVLDDPRGRWRTEHVFDERMPSGRGREFAMSALTGIAFETDGSGGRLPEPVSMLIASPWDLTGAVRVYSRDDVTGAWTGATLETGQPRRDFLPQLRSFAGHRDGRSGIDRVFAGTDPGGIFSGVYDAAMPGRISWRPTPELDISTIATGSFSGLTGRLRISSFSECNGKLYAAIGQQIYERRDGETRVWTLVYTNPRPGHSETGLRGLTTIPNPSGRGESLLAAVEGNAPRIVRVDPATGAETTELDLQTFLGRAWGMRVGYVIAAYNDMTKIPDPKGGDLVLFGLEAFIPPGTSPALGHSFVDVGYGRVESGAWYVVRHSDGRYELHQITASLPEKSHGLVATRTIAASPFPEDRGAIYFGGYDANKAPTHNSAWIIRASAAAATRQ